MKSLRRSSMSSATVASKLSADNLNSVRSSMSASSRSSTPRARASPTAAQAAAAAELPFSIGDYVTIINTEFSGVVRFVGPVHFSMGTWVGVELATPTGKNDGSVQGKRFFTCRPSHGLFVKAIVCAKSNPVDDITGPFSEGEPDGFPDYHAAAQASASATASAGRTPAKATTPTARRRATVGPASSSSSSCPRTLSAAGMTYGGSSTKPKQQAPPPPQQPQQPRTISSQRATVLNALDSTIKGTVPRSSSSNSLGRGSNNSDTDRGRSRGRGRQQQEFGDDSDGYGEYETDGGDGGSSAGLPESPTSSLGSRESTPVVRSRKGASGSGSNSANVSRSGSGEGGDTTVLQQSFDSLTLQVMSLDGRLMALEGVMASLVTSINNVEQSVDKFALQQTAAATPASAGEKGKEAGEEVGGAKTASIQEKTEEIASLKAALRQASELAKQAVVIVLNKGQQGHGSGAAAGGQGVESSGAVFGHASPTSVAAKAAEAASNSSSPARSAPDTTQSQPDAESKPAPEAAAVAAVVPMSPAADKVVAPEGAPTPRSGSSSVAAMMFDSVPASDPVPDPANEAVPASSVAVAAASVSASASVTSMATIKDNADLSVSRVLPDTANAVDSDDESDLDLSRSSIIAAGGVPPAV